MDLDSFLKGLTQLRRGSTAFGPAPHKPIFILTLLDLIDSGHITDNRFYINAELVSAFHENWDLLAPTGFKEDFTLPFYHLQNDKLEGFAFWNIQTLPGALLDKHIKSIHTLAEIVEFASLTLPVFHLLTQQKNRDAVRLSLIHTYFPFLKERYFEGRRNHGSYLHAVEDYVLNEIPKVMRLQVAEEEWGYVRNWTFKKMVPQVYQNTCAISGMKVGSSQGKYLIDACHIVPFSRDQDDRVNNGIALCPNLHRAFDTGLITIDSEYRVMVSRSVTEDKSHPYALNALDGKNILLPRERYQWPSQENLEAHRTSKFKR
jgi:putative restriction endonuclease